MRPETRDISLALARIVHEHLSREDAAFVASVALKQTERYTNMLNAYAGEEMPESDWAALVLRIARRLHSERGGAPS